MDIFKVALINLISIAAVYFLPIQEAALAILALIVIDFLSGIGAALKSGEPLTSKKLRGTVPKIIGYLMALVAAHIFDSHFMFNLGIAHGVAYFLAATELSSIYANISKVTNIQLHEFVKGKLDALKPK